jgi:hypothetical protein
MAWTKSGLYGLAFRDALDTSNIAVDFLSNLHKIALYDNSITPDFLTEAAFTSTGEVSGTGYTAGGQVVVSSTFVLSGATAILTYDLGDQIWASPTTVTAFGAKEYADNLATNDFLVGVNFGGSFTSTAGTFTIQWAAGGVFTITFAP